MQYTPTPTHSTTHFSPPSPHYPSFIRNRSDAHALTTTLSLSLLSLELSVHITLMPSTRAHRPPATPHLPPSRRFRRSKPASAELELKIPDFGLIPIRGWAHARAFLLDMARTHTRNAIFAYTCATARASACTSSASLKSNLYGYLYVYYICVPRALSL